MPLASTYLTSRGTSGSDPVAVSSREGVGLGWGGSEDGDYGCGSGRDTSECSSVWWLSSFFPLGKKMEV